MIASSCLVSQLLPYTKVVMPVGRSHPKRLVYTSMEYEPGPRTWCYFSHSHDIWVWESRGGSRTDFCHYYTK